MFFGGKKNIRRQIFMIEIRRYLTFTVARFMLYNIPIPYYCYTAVKVIKQLLITLLYIVYIVGLL